MVRNICILVIAIGSLAGCGQAPADRTMGAIDVIAVENPSLFVKESKVQCASDSPEDCPSGVALLQAIKNSDKSMTYFNRCTAFLIDAQTAVTNSHCLPENLLKDGADCSSLITLHFPKAPGHPNEDVAKCSTVLKANGSPDMEAPDFGRVLDYAVLRLAAPVSRKPFKVSRDGLKDMMPLTVYSVDPPKGGISTSVLVKHTCTPVQHNSLMPAFVDDHSALGILSDCDIIPGNSGSPAVDSNGHVHATLYAAAVDIELPAGVTPSDGSEFRKMAMGVNAACWELPSTFPARDARCDREVRRALPIEDEMASVPESAFDPIFKTYAANQSSNFKFKKVRVPHVSNPRFYGMMPEIDCIINPAMLPDVDFKMDVPIWAAWHVVDSHYRMNLVIRAHQTTQRRIRVDRDELARKGKTNALWFDDADPARKDKPYGLPLKLCQP